LKIQNIQGLLSIAFKVGLQSKFPLLLLFPSSLFFLHSLRSQDFYNPRTALSENPPPDIARVTAWERLTVAQEDSISPVKTTLDR